MEKTSTEKRIEIIFSKNEKFRINLLAIIILVLAIFGYFTKIVIDTGVLIALIFGCVLLLIEVLPHFIKTIKIGDLELELTQNNLQNDQIFELQKRLTNLENKIGKKKAKELGKGKLQVINDKHRNMERFEAAARGFVALDISNRITAINEMIFYGVGLGKDYLLDKLTSESIGERAGAAAALGSLEDEDLLGSLILSLADTSSFVRYRVVASIAKLIGRGNQKQRKEALCKLQNAFIIEQNPEVMKLLSETIRKYQG